VQSMIFQQAKYRIEEIGVGGNVLDIINERCGIKTDDLVLFVRRSLSAPIHRAAYRWASILARFPVPLRDAQASSWA
jgi:hypothetical protein